MNRRQLLALAAAAPAAAAVTRAAPAAVLNLGAGVRNFTVGAPVLVGMGPGFPSWRVTVVDIKTGSVTFESRE